MKKLGVNIDHVATLRQARFTIYPSPLEAAILCEKAGAHGITAHLREDRRHIQDSDLEILAKRVQRLNMEMAVTEEMIRIAIANRPVNCCLVPEKREELTTEGGLDVAGRFSEVKAAVERLSAAGINVSLFIDPEQSQIEAAAKTEAPMVELHTGAFANARGEAKQREVSRLKEGAEQAHSLGLTVNAGHGIDYENIKLLYDVPYLHELNIGHSIVCRAVFVGLEQAVHEMLERMSGYRA